MEWTSFPPRQAPPPYRITGRLPLSTPASREPPWSLPQVVSLLKKRKAHRIRVFAGGIIPDEDAGRLRRIGIRAIFGPGTSLETIVSTARKIAGSRA